MKKYFLVIDEGTTGTRAILYDRKFQVVSFSYTEITQYTPSENCVEHDFEEIYQKTIEVCWQALKKADVSAKEVISIGITNQRNTVCLWDKKSGKPLLPGIVWQDTRTGKLLEEERKKDYIRKNEIARCGRRYITSSAPVVLKWIMLHHPEIAEKMRRGEAAFGSVETWLIWKLTEGSVHAMTYSNASSLGAYDFLEDGWCEEVFAGAGIPMSVLPELMEEVADFGKTFVFGDPIPITAAAGDQQASMFAQNCREKGSVKCTNGTGTFMDINIGDTYIAPETELAAMVAWSIGGRKTYLYEGMLPVAGAAIQWLRDGMGLISDASESYDMAVRVPDSGGVIFVVTLAGAFVPQYDPFARGAIFGIHKGTRKEHIIRAVLEGIAFGLADIFDIITQQTGIRIKNLRIDGGTSKNNLLAQCFADYVRCEVFRARKGSQATGAGAAQMAALGAGVYSLKTLPEIQFEDDYFFPQMDGETSAQKLARYRDAVKRSAGWMKWDMTDV